jgi:His-Xaa-Ser system radical SAM maturase HxsC
MIPLQIAASTPSAGPFIARLNSEGRAFELDRSQGRTPFDVDLEFVGSGRLVYRSASIELELRSVDAADVDGDVVFVNPARGIAHRLVRAGSAHNTFLITERCDQLCVMCSQPPKRGHSDMLPYFEAAALLAPEGAVLGISGGEPTLFKGQLLPFLERVLGRRPDLSFHVLTNAQHFDVDDVPALSRLPRDRVTWGVPLYSSDGNIHDGIVGKVGAFHKLAEGLAILARSGATLELRTVLMTRNVEALPALARFVASHVPFAGSWAIMQLENIGYGRLNWTELFHDHSQRFKPVGDAIDLARSRGLDVWLYNFPRCTVPRDYRQLAPSTISDWKRRYPAACDGCAEKAECSGLFEWHTDDRGFTRFGSL